MKYKICGAVMALSMFIGVNQVDAAPIHDAAWEGDIGLIEQLLEQGEDINAKDEVGKTALIYAASRGHVGLVEVLCQNNKININAQDVNGDTALIAAVCQYELNAGIIERLIEAGSDVMIKNFRHLNAIDVTKTLEWRDRAYTELMSIFKRHPPVVKRFKTTKSAAKR